MKRIWLGVSALVLEWGETHCGRNLISLRGAKKDIVISELSRAFEGLNVALHILLYVLFSICCTCKLMVPYEKCKCFINTMEPNYKDGWGTAGVQERWPYVSSGMEENRSMSLKTVEVCCFRSAKYYFTFSMFYYCFQSTESIKTLH